ncbi:MAG: crossover junction endodeoxyribonuclease RuvC [Leptospiraceae bacterium]|nr:crossover junction endodeoxyribonuclease RuvC [Leptospiraceae bacterium]
MKFLGIDPGYARMGYGLIEVTGNRAAFVDAGVCETSPKQKEGERLAHMQKFLQQLLKSHSITHAALEQVFLRKDLTTGIRLSEARGVIVMNLFLAGISYSEISPSAMKKSITGSGSAQKKTVQLMTAKLLNLPAQMKIDDAADGLGLAFCAWLRWQAGQIRIQSRRKNNAPN